MSVGNRCEGLTTPNTIGLIFLILSLCGSIVSIILDEITTFVDNDDKIFLYCGWKEWKCDSNYNGNFIDCKSNNVILKYDNICNIEFYGNVGCQTEEAGKIWFITTLTSIILILLSILSIFILHYKRIGGLLSFLGCVGNVYAIAIWTSRDQNPLCGQFSNPSNDMQYLGPSLIILICTSICALFGSILSLHQPNVTENDNESMQLIQPLT